MNLTEDKKEPLRQKPYAVQKEMVAHWLNRIITETVCVC